MTWDELKEKAKELGWYLLKPTKEEVDIKCNGKDYNYFPKKYDEYLAHQDIPLTFYEDKTMFCDENDIDTIPTLIQILSDYDQMYKIMEALK